MRERSVNLSLVQQEPADRGKTAALSLLSQGIVIGRSLFLALFLMAVALIAFAKTEPSQGGHIAGDEIIAAINLAREQPSFYADLLEQRRTKFQGSMYIVSDNMRLRTHEGMRAVDEAVRFLRGVRPVSALAVSPGLCHAAADHCREQAAGAMGHRGSGRSTPVARITRHGSCRGGWAENICYGQRSARDVVLAFIVDDGLRGRGHRRNLFNPGYTVAGAAFGAHAKFGSVCTVEFAGAYSDLPEGAAKTPIRTSFSDPRGAAAGLFPELVGPMDQP